MSEQQQHEMILEMTYASGMQGWVCPTCGQRILFLVPLNDEIFIVESGDLYATHSGISGGLRIGEVQVTQSEEISEESLRPWIKALENLDLDL